MIFHVIIIDLPMRVFLGSDLSMAQGAPLILGSHSVCASFVSVRAEILQNGR